MTSDPAAARFDSVDILRGATIAGMIVVNDPGTWSAVYPPLLHAEWNGWTYTDTIFPFFLFVAGVSLAISLGRGRDAGRRVSALLARLTARSATLVALGLALNGVGFLAFGREHLRFPGVLQRIGVCVFVAGCVWLAAGTRAAASSAATAAILLALYAVLLSGGPLDPVNNLPARVDRAVFGVHTWKPSFDPEGLLSTLPAIATTLLGVCAGQRLRSTATRRRKLLELTLAGTVAAAAGLLWGRVLPINKALWTPSYVLLTGGLAAVALAACIVLFDGREPLARWAAPLRWLGRNAIAAFTLSTLAAIALLAIQITGPDGKPRSLWRAIYQDLFDRFADPRLSSLAFAVVYLLLWIGVFGLLYRRRIFIRL